jgi:transcriptional regulator with XRE-family HTH domain
VRIDMKQLEVRRLNAGLSQRDLGRRAGLSSGAVSMLEQRGSASPATLKKIADVLGCQVIDLLEDRPEKARA